MVSTCGLSLGIERMNNLSASFLRVDTPVVRKRHAHAARPSLELQHEPLPETCGESKNAATAIGHSTELRGATVPVDRQKLAPDAAQKSRRIYMSWISP